MDGWQPIDTAPRDGTKIVVYRPKSENTIGVDWWKMDAWWKSAPAYPPTHWRTIASIKPDK